MSTIKVGDLPLNATSNDIKFCFEKIAPCVEVQIKKTSDKEKYPLNYAFVRMNSRAAAQDVYRTLTANPSLAVVMVDNEPHVIRLGWARTVLKIIIIIYLFTTTIYLLLEYDSSYKSFRRFYYGRNFI